MNRRTVLKSLGAIVLAQVLPETVDAASAPTFPPNVEFIEFRVYGGEMLNDRKLILSHPIQVERRDYGFYGPEGLELFIKPLGPSSTIVNWIGFQTPQDIRQYFGEEVHCSGVNLPIIVAPGSKLTMKLPRMIFGLV